MTEGGRGGEREREKEREREGARACLMTQKRIPKHEQRRANRNKTE